jgi:hypothetical protein
MTGKIRKTNIYNIYQKSMEVHMLVKIEPISQTLKPRQIFMTWLFIPY